MTAIKELKFFLEKLRSEQKDEIMERRKNWQKITEVDLWAKIGVIEIIQAYPDKKSYREHISGEMLKFKE